MYRVLSALPVLGLCACTASNDLSATDASRVLAQGAEAGVVCTDPVVTTEPDGSVTSSIRCERTGS